MTNYTNYNHDKKLEENMHPFLDQIYELIYIINRTRINGTYFQQSGIDFLGKINGIWVIIDEKCATSKINGFDFLSTFVQELAFVGKDSYSQENLIYYCGWAINDDLMTTHYIYVFVNSSNKKFTDITRAELICVKKSYIKKIVNSYGFYTTKDALDFFGLSNGRVCARGSNYKFLKPLFFDGHIYEIKVMQSLDLSEKPINLLLPRNYLKAISDFSCSFKKQNGVLLPCTDDDFVNINEIYRNKDSRMSYYYNNPDLVHTVDLGL